MAYCCLRLDIFNTIASGNLRGEALSEQVRTQGIWCHEDMQQVTAPGWNGCNAEWERVLPAQGSEILLSVCPIIKPRDTEMMFMEICKYTHTHTNVLCLSLLFQILCSSSPVTSRKGDTDLGGSMGDGRL